MVDFVLEAINAFFEGFLERILDKVSEKFGCFRSPAARATLQILSMALVCGMVIGACLLVALAIKWLKK